MFRLSDLLILFPLALVARIAWGLLRPAARGTARRVIVDALAMTYAIALAQVVLGFRYLGGLGADFAPLAHINLVPLATIAEIARPESRAGALGQVVGNVLLFLPLGVLLPLTMARFRTLQSVLLAGLVTSVGIELLQFGFLLSRLMDRAADIDDVILNTIGAVAGFAIWALLIRRFADEAGTPRSTIEADG